jgi:hypothetical protein
MPTWKHLHIPMTSFIDVGQHLGLIPPHSSLKG